VETNLRFSFNITTKEMKESGYSITTAPVPIDSYILLDFRLVYQTYPILEPNYHPDSVLYFIKKKRGQSFLFCFFSCLFLTTIQKR